MPTFLTQALAGEDLTTYGDGSQTRDFCYVGDTIKCVRAIADTPHDDVASEAFNLGSDEEVSITELAERVINVVGADSGITYEPAPDDDPQVRRPYLTKISNSTDWAPEVRLENGLERTADAFG